jgi:hypothetical protein
MTTTATPALAMAITSKTAAARAGSGLHNEQREQVGGEEETVMMSVAVSPPPTSPVIGHSSGGILIPAKMARLAKS